MKIVLVNTFDKIGGAAIATFRLFKGLQKLKHEVFYLVRQKTTNEDAIIATTNSKFKKRFDFLRFVWERFCFRILERDKSIRFAFSIANTGEDISKNKITKDAAIIHLNWTNVGFLSLQSIKKILALKKPVVWTMHDMWLMTGGCHHAYECDNYLASCGNCMYLRKPHTKDISYRILNKKKKIFSQNQVHIVAVSKWLAERAKQSALLKNFPIHVIHNPIDTQLFQPFAKSVVRKQFNLNNDKIYLLFGASRIDDPIKGWNYFEGAIKEIIKEEEWKNKIEIITFGRLKNMAIIENFKLVPLHHFGIVTNPEKLCQLYNCADVTIASSLYETQGQVAVESLCCGIPIVAFNTSGLTEVVIHQNNGYLAEYKSIADLAKGIKWCLDKNNYTQLANNSRQTVVEKFAEKHIIQQYENLYSQILKAPASL